MEEKLKAEFKDYIIYRGKYSYYVKSEVVLQFIIACSKYDLAVIGMEGFILHSDNKIEPQMDMIEDLSAMKAQNWNDYKVRCNTMALRIMNETIAEHPAIISKVVFNFSLSSKGEYNSYHPDHKLE